LRFDEQKTLGTAERNEPEAKTLTSGERNESKKTFDEKDDCNEKLVPMVREIGEETREMDVNSRALDIEPLKNAYSSFMEALAEAPFLEENYYKIFRAAIIQNFEFSFELCWKFMRRWLEVEEKGEVDAMYTKKDLFRIAHRKGLISDSVLWFTYLDARNETTHAYDEIKADKVYTIAKDFITEFAYFIRELEKRI
jgi:nucleotidyltransferase substrate binding protein (TIGR01987 family)